MTLRFPLILALLLLSACASNPDEERPGVKEAKACQEVLETAPQLGDGLVIKSCTNDGVWTADQYDSNGFLIKRFDFLNRQYAGPETGGGFVPVESMGPDAMHQFSSVREAIQTLLLKS